MLSVRETILSIIEQHPGIGSTELAERAGKEPRHARRAAKELEQTGAIRIEVNGDGYAFWPANGNGDRGYETPYVEPIKPAKVAVNGNVNVASINGHDVTDSRLAPKPLLALPPPGGTVTHHLPDTPVTGGRGRTVAHPNGVALSMPAFFEASGDDGEWLANQLAQRAANEVAARADRVHRENARLRQQVAVAKQEREPSMAEMGLATGVLALNVFGGMASRPKAGLLAPERAAKPLSAAAIKREKQEREEAEWAEYAARHGGSRHKLELEDDVEYEVEDMEPTEQPPRKRSLAFLNAPPKSNGHVEPAEGPAGMSLGVKWTAAGIAFAVGVLAVIKFPLR